MRPSLSILAFVVLAVPAVPPSRALTPGTLTVQEDNDVFALSDRSDRGYTNGTRLTWSWDAGSMPAFAHSLAGRLCGTDLCERSASIAIGQNMYTPEDLQSPVKVVGDRPYGGWLFSGLTLEAQKGERIDSVSLYLGVVGRRSYAAEAQIFAHKAIVPSAPEPLGWDNQVGDFPGVVVAVERRLRYWERLDSTGRPYLDLIPSAGGMIGNVFVHGGVGATARIGYNLPDRFLRTGASARPEPATVPGTTVRSRWDGYVFATAEARLVARDVFLDAKDSEYGIRREPFVRDRRIGASLRYGWLRIGYAHTLRSPEFEPDSRSHSYGTYTLSVGTHP